MKSEILAKLRNILAKLYPDEASMRRISHDAAIDLARVSLNSSATNNWHSILVEAENVGHVDALLTVILQDYGSNQALLDAYQAYRQIASQPTQNDDHRPTLNTGGGASVGNNVQVSHDFVGRDQINTTNIVFINWESLGSEFILELNHELHDEERRKEELKKRQNVDARSEEVIQNNIERLTQKITELSHFDWTSAEQAYLDKLLKLYDRVRILGSSEDVPLGNIFTQVYILDKPTARQRHDISELRKQGKKRIEFQRQPGKRIHGMELVKTKQNLFILGKPGAGKTTFLKYITIQAARKQLPYVPIFVSLNQWADSKWGKTESAVLLPFIVEQFEICDFPEAEKFIKHLLKEGRALVLFDGLDEVKQDQDQRRRLTSLLQEFAYKYDKSQHLITCRIAASDYAFAGFTDVEVADFTNEQVQEYAHKWFSSQQKKWEIFIDELVKPENQGLAELCNIPLLLALLCLTFDNNMRFPPSRADLYEDALEALLRKWDSNRQIQRDEIYRELSHKRKLQLLMNIAVPNFEKGEIFFRQRDLEKQIATYLAKLPGALPVDIIDGTAILKSIEAQHSILVERAQGIYSFSHLTFQEYLTARYLAENRSEESIFSLISRHLTDQRWREIFLLTASLLNDADYFVASICDTINHLFSNAPKLCHLLIWAYDRTINSSASVERRVFVQLAYLSLLLSLDRSMARYRANCLELERSRESERYSKTAIFGEVDRAFARSLDRKSAHERERDRERTYERALNQVLTKAHMFWISLVRTYQIDFDPDSEGVSSRTLNLDQALMCANIVVPIVKTRNQQK